MPRLVSEFDIPLQPTDKSQYGPCIERLLGKPHQFPPRLREVWSGHLPQPTNRECANTGTPGLEETAANVKRASKPSSRPGLGEKSSSLPPVCTRIVSTIASPSPAPALWVSPRAKRRL